MVSSGPQSPITLGVGLVKGATCSDEADDKDDDGDQDENEVVNSESSYEDQYNSNRSALLDNVYNTSAVCPLLVTFDLSDMFESQKISRCL